MASPYAFVTLVTSDYYLPGALTLAAALRDVHPTPAVSPEVDFQTVCLVTPETVDVSTIKILRKVFDAVIGVEVIAQTDTKGLALLGRPDLDTVLTKLHIFRLTQYSKIIFLDADVLPIQPISHLFAIPHEFSAAPDVGWPDIFNSGVLVLSPGEDKFQELSALLNTKGTWDGGDQGILNEWRGQNWNRISFTYNTTPTAAYTYAPAYERFGSQIKAIHFIGPNKPWSHIAFRAPQTNASSTSEPSEVAPLQQRAYDYGSLLDRWFAVYDGHYRAQTTVPEQQFEVRKYISAWDEKFVTGAEMISGSAPISSGPTLGLDDLRDLAVRGLSSTAISRSHPGEGRYFSMPVEGRVDLMRPRPIKIEVTEEATRDNEPETRAVTADLATPRPNHFPLRLSEVGIQGEISSALHTPGPYESPPSLHITPRSLPSSPMSQHMEHYARSKTAELSQPSSHTDQATGAEYQHQREHHQHYQHHQHQHQHQHQHHQHQHQHHQHHQRHHHDQQAARHVLASHQQTHHTSASQDYLPLIQGHVDFPLAPQDSSAYNRQNVPQPEATHGQHPGTPGRPATYASQPQHNQHDNHPATGGRADSQSDFHRSGSTLAGQHHRDVQSQVQSVDIAHDDRQDKPIAFGTSAEPPRSPSPPMMLWNPAVEPPPNAPPPPTAFVSEPYFPNVWDQTPSKVHDRPPPAGSPESPQPSSTFFQPPPPPAIPEMLRQQGHYRRVTGESDTPSPDASKVKPVFPWEDKPRHMPGRVFPESDRPPVGLFIQPSPSPPSALGSVQSTPSPTQPKVSPSVVLSPLRGLPVSLTFANAWDSVPSIQNYASKLVRPAKQPTPLDVPFDDEEWRRSRRDSFDGGSRDGDDEDEGEDEEVVDPQDDIAFFGGEDSDGGSSSRHSRHSRRSSRRGSDASEVFSVKGKRYQVRGVQTIPKETRSMGVQVATKASPEPARSINTKRDRSSSFGPTIMTSAMIPRHEARTSSPLSQSSPISSRELKFTGSRPVTGPITSKVVHRTSPTVPTASPLMRQLSNDSFLTSSPSQASSLGPVSPPEGTSPVLGPSSGVRKANRVWDPARGVDVFKRGSEEVLARFLKMGSWEEEDAAAQ